MPRDLDAVIVSHAHLDHSGNLLTIADRNIVIVGSEATRDITCELLHDLIKVQKINGNIVPYDSESVLQIEENWLPKSRVALLGMEIKTFPAGHVLGANMTQIETEGKTILYTGDFCLHSTEILEGANLKDLPMNPDVLIMESTYGGVVRESRNVLVERLFDVINETYSVKGNVLIPTFAFHRCQEMSRRIDLAIKTKRIPQYNAYYISGLAHNITKFFNEYKELLRTQIKKHTAPFNYSRVRRLKRTTDIRGPAIVICTAGFGHAGASRSLLNDWAGNENNCIIISSGYLPPDSPLLMAKEKRVIENDGELTEVKARIEQIELSGHADQAELIKLVSTIRPLQTFLVHGTYDQSLALSKKIDSYTDVRIPVKDETFVL